MEEWGREWEGRGVPGILARVSGVSSLLALAIALALVILGISSLRLSEVIPMEGPIEQNYSPSKFGFSTLNFWLWLSTYNYAP